MFKALFTTLGLIASPMSAPEQVLKTNERFLERFEYLLEHNQTVQWIAQELTLKMNTQRLPTTQPTPILSVHTSTHCQLVLNKSAEPHAKYDYFEPIDRNLSDEAMDFIIGHELGHCVLYAGLAKRFDFFKEIYLAQPRWKATPGYEFAERKSLITGRLHAEIFADKFGLYLAQSMQPQQTIEFGHHVMEMRQESSAPYSDWETFRFINPDHLSKPTPDKQAKHP